MGQVLHESTTTKYAVQTAVQRSQASLVNRPGFVEGLKS